MTPLLAISTATEMISAAVLLDDGTVFECPSGVPARSEDIMSYVEKALAASGVGKRDLSSVCVAVGPGSYGGLRGALAAAKALSQTLGIPLVCVPTLEAIAYNARSYTGLVVAALSACREEYNVAFFGASGSESSLPRRVVPDLLMNKENLAALLAKISGEALLLASDALIHATVLTKNPMSRLLRADPSLGQPAALAVAMLGLQRLRAGRLCDAMLASPYYSLDPNIRGRGKV